MSAEDSTEKNVAALLPAYAAGELSEEERAEVSAALARSPRLRAELERYQQLFLLMTVVAAREIDVPSGLQSQIARQVTLQYYFKLIATIGDDLFGFYGRALAFYLGLR